MKEKMWFTNWRLCGRHEDADLATVMDCLDCTLLSADTISEERVDGQ